MSSSPLVTCLVCVLYSRVSPAALSRRVLVRASHRQSGVSGEALPSPGNRGGDGPGRAEAGEEWCIRLGGDRGDALSQSPYLFTYKGCRAVPARGLTLPASPRRARGRRRVAQGRRSER